MATATLYLDIRDIVPGVSAEDIRKRHKDIEAPLKVKVYVNRENIRHYKTNLSFSIDQFEESYNAKSPRGENRSRKTKIEAIKIKADNIIEQLGDGFTFEKFKRSFYKSNYDKGNVITYFNDYIEKLNSNGQVGTSDLYRLSLNSLLAFKGAGKPVDYINFQSITVKFLEDYERWFTKEIDGKKTKSLTSVGIYMRNLRAIYKIAIKTGEVSADLYPFGKDKYEIPTGSNTKKAIDNAALKALYNAELETGTSMRMARDYWFFSFQANGLNFKDIASLRYRDLSETSFSFRREKTKRTIKAKNMPPIMVPITEPIRAFINRYGNTDRDRDNYIFPIFSKGMSEAEKMRVNRNFIRFVNDNMERLADQLKLKIKIGTMVARHTFTTKATKAVGLEFAQEALGHTTMATTQNYFAGFESETKKKVADGLLNFD